MEPWVGLCGKIDTGNHGFSREIWGFGGKTSENQSIEWLLNPLVEFGDTHLCIMGTMTIDGQSRSQPVGYPQVRPATACWSLRTAGGILNWQ